MARKGFVLSMEDAEVAINNPEEVTVEVSGEVEQQAAEVETDAAEIVEGSDEVVAAVEEAETLDTIIEVVEPTVVETDGEGMEPVAAQVAEVAVESICSRLGIQYTKMSMEAFGSSNNRVTATRLAVEGWKETVARVWEAVKKFFTTIWEKLKALWSKIAGFATNLEKQATKLKEAAKSVKGEVKEAKFKAAGIAKAVGANFGEVTAVLAENTKLAAETGKYIDGQVKSMTEAASTGTYTPVANGADGAYNLGAETLTIANGEVSTEANKREGEEVDTLTKEQVTDVANRVAAAAKVLKEGGKAEAQLKKLNSASEALFKNIEKMNEEGDAKEKLAAIRKAGIAAGKSTLQVLSKSQAALFQNSKLALNYGFASLKQYKEEAAA